MNYLPYTEGNNGWHKDDFVSQNEADYLAGISPHYQFYQNTPKISADQSPYSVIIHEPSPLNRVIKQGAPGTAWQPDADHSYTSTDHTIKFAYEFNAANEVLLWTFTNPTEEYTIAATNAFGKINAGTATVPVYYAANQLYKKTKQKTKSSTKQLNIQTKKEERC